MKNRQVLTGVLAALLMVSAGVPAAAATHATKAAKGRSVTKVTSKAALRGLTTKYNAKSKALTINGQAKKVAKVAISYNGKHLKTVKVSKQGRYVASLKFKGYGKFGLVGQNKRGKKVTAVKTVTAKDYATKAVRVYSLNKQANVLKVTLGVQPNRIISVKDAKTAKTIYQTRTPKKLHSDFYTLKVTAKKLKGHSSLMIIQKATNKKASPAVALPAIKNNQNISY